MPRTSSGCSRCPRHDRGGGSPRGRGRRQAHAGDHVGCASATRVGGAVVLKAENLQRTGQLQGPRSDEQARRPRRPARRRALPPAAPATTPRRSPSPPAMLGVPCEIFVPAGAPICQDRGLPGLRRDRRSKAATRSTKRSPPRSGAPTTPAWCSATRTTTSPSIAGQATLGRELVDDVADLRRVIVPLGGGGLAVGHGHRGQAPRPDDRGRRRAGRRRARRTPTSRPAAGPVVTLADGIAVKQPGRDHPTR